MSPLLLQVLCLKCVLSSAIVSYFQFLGSNQRQLVFRRQASPQSTGRHGVVSSWCSIHILPLFLDCLIRFIYLLTFSSHMELEPPHLSLCILLLIFQLLIPLLNFFLIFPKTNHYSYSAISFLSLSTVSNISAHTTLFLLLYPSKIIGMIAPILPWHLLQLECEISPLHRLLHFCTLSLDRSLTREVCRNFEPEYH